MLARYGNPVPMREHSSVRCLLTRMRRPSSCVPDPLFERGVVTEELPEDDQLLAEDMAHEAPEQE